MSGYLLGPRVVALKNSPNSDIADTVDKVLTLPVISPSFGTKTDHYHDFSSAKVAECIILCPPVLRGPPGLICVTLVPESIPISVDCKSTIYVYSNASNRLPV